MRHTRPPTTSPPPLSPYHAHISALHIIPVTAFITALAATFFLIFIAVYLYAARELTSTLSLGKVSGAAQTIVKIVRRVAFALFLSFLTVCAYPITVNMWWQDLTTVAGIELFVQSALMPFSFSLTHVFLFRLLHGSLLEQGRRVTAASHIASQGRSAAQEKKTSRLVEMPNETPGTSASNRQQQSGWGGMAKDTVPNPLTGGDNGGGSGGNHEDQSPWRMDHGKTVLVDVPLHGTADSGELNNSTTATANSTEVSGAG
jgi:hypothetical protein